MAFHGDFSSYPLPELLQWLNTFIYSLKNDGVLNDLSMKYRNAPLPALPVF